MLSFGDTKESISPSGARTRYKKSQSSDINYRISKKLIYVNLLLWRLQNRRHFVAAADNAPSNILPHPNHATIFSAK
jgi:hypothetical protein